MFQLDFQRDSSAISNYEWYAQVLFSRFLKVKVFKSFATTTKCIFDDEFFRHQKFYISSPMICDDKICFLAMKLVSSRIPYRQNSWRWNISSPKWSDYLNNKKKIGNKTFDCLMFFLTKNTFCCSVFKLTFSKVYQKHFYIIERQTSTFKYCFEHLHLI